MESTTEGSQHVAGSDSWSPFSSCDYQNLFLETETLQPGAPSCAFFVCLPDSPIPAGPPSPGTKRSDRAALLTPHALRPRFPNSVPSGVGRMIASHLLAYFFTELNHDQVQKVSKRGRGGWLASENLTLSAALSPGSRPTRNPSLRPYGDPLSPHSGPRTRKISGPRGKTLGWRSHVR